MLADVITTIDQASKMTAKHASPSRREALFILNIFSRTLSPLPLILRNRDWQGDFTNRDKRLITELVNGTLRWQIQLDWILRQFVHGQFAELPLSIQNILRLSLYQLRQLNQVPDYAVVDEAGILAREFHEIKYARLVNGVLRNYLRNQHHLQFPRTADDQLAALAIGYAFPRWQVELLVEQYGSERTASILDQLNQRPNLTIRINTEKISVAEFYQQLEKREISFSLSKFLPEFVSLEEKAGTIQELPGFDEGWFFIQDVSAGFVAHLTAPQPDQQIAEICAAPGGKLTHVAQLRRDQGIILGMDISRSRLAITAENIRRLGYQSIRLLQGDARRLPHRQMDMIVIDAPCSGLGTIRKNPDIKLRRKPEDLPAVQQLQLQILIAAAERLKPHGSVIYSTCTINKEENERIIAQFIHKQPQFKIEPISSFLILHGISAQDWLSILPDQDSLDGSFCVRLRKD